MLKNRCSADDRMAGQSAKPGFSSAHICLCGFEEVNPERAGEPFLFKRMRRRAADAFEAASLGKGIWLKTSRACMFMRP